MVKEIKTTINKKDLYSKQYFNLKTNYKKDNVTFSVKKGIVDIFLKIFKEGG